MLSDPEDIDSSTMAFTESSVTGNLWNSGSPATLVISVPAAGGTLDLTIREARIAMSLSSDHMGAVSGKIGGVLGTEELVAQIKALAGAVSPVLCGGPILENILTRVRQASDIMKDGTQDPAAVCDGISIGLGFEASAVMLGDIAPPGPPAQDPCAMQ